MLKWKVICDFCDKKLTITILSKHIKQIYASTYKMNSSRETDSTSNRSTINDSTSNSSRINDSTSR